MTAKDVLSDAITAWDQAANAEKSEPPPPPPEAPAEPAPEPVHNLPAAMQQFQQPVRCATNAVAQRRGAHAAPVCSAHPGAA